MSIRVIALLVGLGFGGAMFPMTAHAQKESKISKEEAAKRFANAKQEYSLQEYGKALESFKELYRLTNEPVYLFNIAQCNRQLGNLEEALKGFKTFIQNAPDHELRPNAQTRITELEASLAQKKLEDDKAAAEAKRIADEKRAAELEAMKISANQNSKPFFLGAIFAGASGVLVGGTGVTLGVLANKSIANPQDQSDLDKASRFNKLSLPLSVTGDILTGIAIASAVAGLVVKKRGASREVAQLTLSPKGAQIAIRF